MKPAITIVMASFLMMTLGGQKTVRSQAASQDKGSKIGVASAATEGCGAAEGGRGPTVLLSYSKEVLEKSPLGSFMYFLPLISPVAMGREVSPDNQQQVGVISYERKVTARSFSVTCEFEMLGDGFNRYTFDSPAMIAMCAAALTKGDTLTQVLDYIDLKGEGFGSIQIRGTVNGPVQTVTEVELAFNARRRQSPVTIGLYQAKRKSGLFEYKNRSDEMVARVNSLSFKRGENPRMGITVASIGKKGDNGLLSHIKAAIANLFIKPVEVDSLGNETLLKFGYALLKQEPAFTFPKAAKLKDVKIAAATPKPERQPEASE